MATQASNEFTTLQEKAPQYGLVHPLLLISVAIDTQQLFLTNEAGEILQQWPISSSKHGTGNEVDSGQTPLGLHSVVERYGTSQPTGTVFSSRRVEAQCWDGEPTDQDLITTRILRLTGLEPAINGNSYKRYIYIHGTPHEEQIGNTASSGCIRMKNEDVAELYNLCHNHHVLCTIRIIE